MDQELFALKSRDLEELILQVTGRQYSMVKAGVWNSFYPTRVIPQLASWEQESLERFLKVGAHPTLQSMMNYLCSLNVIPPGEYLVSIER